MKLNFTFGLLIFFSPLLAAQQNWIILDSINTPLPTNLIRVVETDSYGNIWLGTNNGLYKYDGVFWNNYTTENSQIPYNSVDNFFLDRNDNIWFMAGDPPYPYFVKFNGNTWELTDTAQTCFPDNSRLSRNFVVDGYSTKWIHTNSNIIRYDGSGCIYFDEQSVGILTTDCNKIDVDENDNFFFISQSYEPYHYGGIARTAPTGWLYNTLIAQGWPVDFTVNSSLGLVWVCSFNYHIGRGELIKISYDSLQVLSVYDYYNPTQQGVKFGKFLVTDLNGNIWQSYIDATGENIDLGLICFSTAAEQWILYDTNNSPLPSDNIKDIAVDIYNDKLIATDNGLAIFNEQGINFPESLTGKDTLDFGEVEVGASSSEELALYNYSYSDLIIDSLSFADNYFYSNTNLPVIVPSEDSSFLSISFQPDSVGIYFEKLLLYTSSGIYVQNLYGKGKLPTGIVTEEQSFSFSLSNNFPNPFNPTTKIKYQIPELSKVKLAVYDVLGREISILVNEEKPAGSHEVEFNGTGLPSGVYFYRIETIPNGRQAGNYSNTKKFVLLK